MKKLSRRKFIVGSTKSFGLVAGYSLFPNIISAKEVLNKKNWDHQLFLTMHPNGKATVHITKTEMGQHIGTALAQIVAEELEINWNDINIDYPDSDKKWGLMITGSSWSINWTFDRNSRIGASARIALIEAGAKLMSVKMEDCFAKESKVIHKTSDKFLTYKDILSRKSINRVFDEKELKSIKLKKFGEYKIIGKSVPSLDIPEKINGTAKYGIDAFVPNMVYGKIIPWPTRYGAKPIKVDDKKAKEITGYVGVYVKRDDPSKVNSSYVIALAETYWAAEKAAKVINVDWNKGPNAKISSESIRDYAISQIKDPDAGAAFVQEGDYYSSFKNAQLKHKAVYETAIGYHGMMEPMNCLAMEKNGKWHLFTANQWQLRMTNMVADALNVEAEDVVHHQQYAGCGFGRRLEPDAAVPAALAAKFINRPVKLIYTREDDIRFNFNRTLTYQVLEGGAEFGKITSLKHDNCAGWSTFRQAPGFMADSKDNKGKVDQFSTNGSDHWYNIPNHYVRSIRNEMNDQSNPPGSVRSVAPFWSFFAVESYMDEMAHLMKTDPLEFRLRHINPEGINKGIKGVSFGGSNRLRNALLVAAGKSGYGVKSMQKDNGVGISVVSSQERQSPGWTACVAEIHVDKKNGIVTPKKLTIAMDVGTAINPENVKAQIEGSALYGVSQVLYENITMKNGSIEQGNFDTWTPLRLNQAPEIESIVIENGHYPVGAGEAAMTAIGPAIANAIYNAVGVRIRSLPITPEKVLNALKEV